MKPVLAKVPEFEARFTAIEPTAMTGEGADPLVFEFPSKVSCEVHLAYRVKAVFVSYISPTEYAVPVALAAVFHPAKV